jgi:hypothetical protein
MSMEEILIDIPNYKGLYKGSSLGKIWSVPRKILKNKEIGGYYLEGIPNGKGYLQVKLQKNGISKTIKVHQLIAMCFHNHIPDGHYKVVNHKDFDKLNNVPSNLQVVTPRVNGNKKHIKSSSQYTGVCWHKKANKWSAQIRFKYASVHLGLFTDEEEAFEIYQKALRYGNLWKNCKNTAEFRKLIKTL